MATIDICELSIEQEEYLVELLCSRGACAIDLLARELDEACRAHAARSRTQTRPDSGLPFPPR